MGLFGALAGAIGRKNKGGQSDTSKPFHTHASKSNNQTAGAAPAPVEKPQTYEPRSDGSGQQAPVSGGRQDQPNNFVSNKSQELGAELFEGQQMVEQRNQIKSIRSSPVPVPGSQDENLSNYGSNFTSPMNQGPIAKPMQKDILDIRAKEQLATIQPMQIQRPIRSGRGGRIVRSKNPDLYKMKPTPSRKIKFENPSPMNQGEKVNDTIYKRNGNQMNKMDFNKIINSNDSTIKNTRRHNDSVSARADSVDKMFPMESSSMKDLMMGRKLQKEINKGKKSITEGIQSGSFTREVKGKEIDRRSFNTIG